MCVGHSSDGVFLVLRGESSRESLMPNVCNELCRLVDRMPIPDYVVS